MKKFIFLGLVLAAMSNTSYAAGSSTNSAQQQLPPPKLSTAPSYEYNSTVVVDKRTDGLDALVDIPLRFSGFVQTVVGTAVFIGVSPITAFMNAFPPHDSFDKTAQYLILQPARYTFERPVGEYNYDSRP